MEEEKKIDRSTPVPSKYKSHYYKIIDQKLNTFDWLSDIKLPNGQKPINIVEISFRNGSRKGFYKFEKNMEMNAGLVVAVEAKTGHDIGMISLTGPLVTRQLLKKHIPADSEVILKIYRVATEKDIQIWNEAQSEEHKILVRARQIVNEQKLNMKISDVEYQGDKKKITFYFIAEGRIDFRALVKLYVTEFRAKIEMRQISLRQEAALVGGIGPCGKELCCTTWMSDFKHVTNSAARIQNLDMNPERLASACGRLKCCLNFEVDIYQEALNAFPKGLKKLTTKKGEAKLFKKDILKRVMVFKYTDHAAMYTLTIEEAKEIAALNKNEKFPDDLRKHPLRTPAEEETTKDIIEEVSIEQLSQHKKKKKKNKRRWYNKKKKK